jgi:putative acetyltransferase
MTTFHHLNFKLRSPKSNEGPLLHALITDVLAGYGLPYNQEVDDNDFEDLQAAFAGSRECFWVAEDENGRIVGCGGLKQHTSQEAEICKLYLHPAARGKGLGKRILHCLVDFARASGYRQITLETNSKLSEALALYERFGFQRFPHNNERINCDLRYELIFTSPLAETAVPVM